MLPLRNIAFTLVRRNLPLYRLNPPQRTIANATTKPHKKPSIKRTPEERKAAADPRKKLMPPPKKEKPPPDTSKLYENGYTTKSTVPTFIFQKSLPHLPVPPLDETCTKFEEACNPLLRYLIVFFALDNHPQSDTEIEETQSVIRDFKEKLGPKLQVFLYSIQLIFIRVFYSTHIRSFHSIQRIHQAVRQFLFNLYSLLIHHNMLRNNLMLRGQSLYLVK